MAIYTNTGMLLSFEGSEVKQEFIVVNCLKKSTFGLSQTAQCT